MIFPANNVLNGARLILIVLKNNEKFHEKNIKNDINAIQKEFNEYSSFCYHYWNTIFTI